MARRYCKPAEFSNENDKPYVPGTPNTITLGNWGWVFVFLIRCLRI